VVIDRQIRELLNIRPGMLAVQLPVDGHVEIYFLPAPHNESLAGAARPFIRRWPSPEELDNMEDAWAEEAARRYQRLSAPEEP
jgi:hypothetical protein